jgi:hypothetical protein
VALEIACFSERVNNFGRVRSRPNRNPWHVIPAANVTGQQAYATYSATAGKFIAERGGRVVFSTPVDQVMIGCFTWLAIRLKNRDH